MRLSLVVDITAGPAISRGGWSCGHRICKGPAYKCRLQDPSRASQNGTKPMQNDGYFEHPGRAPWPKMPIRSSILPAYSRSTGLDSGMGICVRRKTKEHPAVGISVRCDPSTDMSFGSGGSEQAPMVQSVGPSRFASVRGSKRRTVSIAHPVRDVSTLSPEPSLTTTEKLCTQAWSPASFLCEPFYNSARLMWTYA